MRGGSLLLAAGHLPGGCGNATGLSARLPSFDVAETIAPGWNQFSTGVDRRTRFSAGPHSLRQ